MATDFVSEVDKKFFVDNLLLTEDWDDSLNRYDDLSSLLDMESNLGGGLDPHKVLPIGMEMTMLNEGLPDPLPDLSDGSDSGLDCGLPIKDEPLSPASSNFSDGSQDSFAQMSVDSLLASPKSEPSLEFSYESFLQGVGDQTDILALSAAAATLPDSLDLSPQDLDLSMPVAMDTTPVSSTCVIDTHSEPLSRPGLVPVTKIVTLATTPSTLTSPVIVTQSPQQTVVKVTESKVNAKVKFQPKPVPLIKPKVGLPVTAPGKPLVLTAEEFAKLTAQGVLQFQPPVKTEPSPTSPVKPSPLHSTHIHMPHVVTDVKAVKRQQRMIKNRESACLSRKRKKEYLSSLEEKLHEFNSENTRLKQENSSLRKKICQLQNENEQLKSCVGPTLNLNNATMKKVTCLFAVMLLVSFNLSPLTSILSGQRSSGLDAAVPHDFMRHGRTLKAFNENLDDSVPSASPNGETRSVSSLEQLLRAINLDLGGGKQMDRNLMLLRDSAFCPGSLNTTESQRLMHELTGWVMGHKEEIRKKEEALQQNQQRQNKKERRLRRKKYLSPHTLSNAVGGAVGVGDLRYKDSNQLGQYGVQLFTGAERHYNDLMKSIRRRNDTFYVVSFRRDHLLLPATAHNKTTRPKMSLVMPAVSLNASMDDENSFAMMQIECEVMATRLVHVDKASVPQQFHENTTSHDDYREGGDGWKRYQDSNGEH